MWTGKYFNKKNLKCLLWWTPSLPNLNRGKLKSNHYMLCISTVDWSRVFKLETFKFIRLVNDRETCQLAVYWSSWRSDFLITIHQIISMITFCWWFSRICSVKVTIQLFCSCFVFPWKAMIHVWIWEQKNGSQSEKKRDWKVKWGKNPRLTPGDVGKN